MSVLPTKIVDQITFGESHYNVWIENAAEIGVPEAEANAVKVAVTDGRAAFDAAQIARNAAKSATINQNIKIAQMNRLMSELIKKVRLYAQATDNPNVYALADIPAPAAPSPAPAPSQPTNLSAQIEPGGALRITFKAVNESSNGAVTYIVKRKLATESAFRVIGTTGTSRPVAGLPRGFKAFVDETLPSGSNNFQYMIQGQRGDVFGTSSEIFTVVIGVGGDGQQVATLKMAA